MQPGAHLGHYEILSALGKGGMGEVWRARDTKLRREVAIKTLPPVFARDPDRVARLIREATSLAAVNHPNVAAIHGLEEHGDVRFIVLELVEGDTLADRLIKKPLSVRQALEAAQQIAAALEAAHERGIVHRDLKPANIKITPQGRVKVLDFGLAKTLEPTGSEGATEVTELGAVIGTAPYMSPEQVRGEAAAPQSDIWAFGVVLYEMLAGVSPFARPTSTETFARVLEAQPDLALLPPETPRGAQHLVRRCLEKDPKRRVKHASDARIEVEDALAEPASGPPPPMRSGISRRAALTGGVALGLGGAGLGGVLLAGWPHARPQSPPARGMFETETVVPASMRPIAPAISPDGKWLAYVSLAQAEPRLLLQFLNNARPIDLSAGSNIPVPARAIIGGIDILFDGSAVGFPVQPSPTGLWTTPGVYAVPAPLGGPPRRVAEGLASIRWSPDGKRIVAVKANPLTGDSIVVANADGTNLNVLVPEQGGLHRHQVAWAADGKYVYWAQTIEPDHVLGTIWRMRAEGGTPESVIETPGLAMHPAPTPDGRALIYAGYRNGEGLNLWRHAFDGSPDVRLTTGSGEYTEPYVSRDGVSLVCVARRRIGELVRIEVGSQAAEPHAVSVVGTPGSSDGDPSMAPGSGRIFVTSTRGERRGIWSLDASGNDARPITSGDAVDQRPVVSPDGARLAFISNRSGRRGVWAVATEGGAPRELVSGEVLDRVSWSADGTRVVYALAGETKSTVWTVGADGLDPKQIPNATGRTPVWSPAGDLIAVVAAREGRPEVHFVTPAGEVPRAPVSIEPVSVPTAMAWSPDGKRLAMVNLSGRASSEVWLLAVDDGTLVRLHQFTAGIALEGVAWTPDGKSVVVGRRDFESEVLLLRGAL